MTMSTKPWVAGVLVLGLSACAGVPAQVADGTPAKKECIRETGTHIKVEEGKCAPVHGRVITDKDLERSGAQTLNEAISKVGRH